MTTQKSIVRAKGSLSNGQYHRMGKPNWWVRLGTGDGATFLPISATRGDERLSKYVDVPPGTTLYVGCGSRNGIRETVVTTAISAPPV